MAIVCGLRFTEKDEVEKAGKFRTALGQALTKLAEQLGSA